MITTTEKKPQAFILKGSMYTLTVIQLFTTDLEVIIAQLKQTIAQSPTFFKNAPLLIDLQKLFSSDLAIEFTPLIAKMRELALIPVATINGNDEQNQQATAAGLGIMSNSKPDKNNAKQQEATVTKQETPETKDAVKNILIKKPVRSGQQIYARNADLIVLGSVSPGAEVIADGNIHIYGTLRGRALAGVNGNKQAHIFCQELNAELISIAGVYKLPDQIKTPPLAQTYKITLEDEHLTISAI